MVDEDDIFAFVNSLVDQTGDLRVVLINSGRHLWPGNDVGYHDQRVGCAGEEVVDQGCQSLGCAARAGPHIVGAGVHQNNIGIIPQCLISHSVMNLCDGFATDAFVIARERYTGNIGRAVGEGADKRDVPSGFGRQAE